MTAPRHPGEAFAPPRPSSSGGPGTAPRRSAGLAGVAGSSTRSPPAIMRPSPGPGVSRRRMSPRARRTRAVPVAGSRDSVDLDRNTVGRPGTGDAGHERMRPAQALLTRIPSISTRAPLGSEATPTAARAG